MYSAYSTYTIVHTQYRPCPRVQVPISMMKDSGIEVDEKKTTGLICLGMFVTGVVMTTDAGQDWVDLFDGYVCLLSLFMICGV